MSAIETSFQEQNMRPKIGLVTTENADIHLYCFYAKVLHHLYNVTDFYHSDRLYQYNKNGRGHFVGDR